MRRILTLTVVALMSASQARADEPELPIGSPDFQPITKGPGFTGQPRYQRQDPNVLFVNFDGADMQSCGWGNDDPHDNCSSIFSGIVDPFSGDTSQQAAVIQAVRVDLAAYNMKVTTTRPGPEIDYDMEMVGNWNPPPEGGFAGVAPSIDCLNGSGGEVSFSLEYSGTTQGIAKVILQEVAHTWGLEHVDSEADLLYPTTAGFSNPSFTDECSTIVELNGNNQPVPTDSVRCPSQHSAQCGQSTLQNSHKELLDIFGPAIPDTTPPGFTIVEPTEGAMVPRSFDLVLSLEDTESPVYYTLVFDLVDDGEGPRQLSLPGPGELTLFLENVRVGTQTLKVTVEDEVGNAASDQVTFHVEQVEDATSSDATSYGSGTGDASSGLETSEGASEDAGSDDVESDDGTEADAGENATVDAGSDDVGSDAGLMTASDGNDLGDKNGCACSADAMVNGASHGLVRSWPALLAFLTWRRRRPSV